MLNPLLPNPIRNMGSTWMPLDSHKRVTRIRVACDKCKRASRVCLKGSSAIYLTAFETLIQTYLYFFSAGKAGRACVSPQLGHDTTREWENSRRFIITWVLINRSESLHFRFYVVVILNARNDFIAAMHVTFTWTCTITWLVHALP